MSEMDMDVIEGEGKGVEEEGDLNANAPDGTSTDGGPSFEGVATSPGDREGANVTKRRSKRKRGGDVTNGEDEMVGGGEK